MNPYGPAIAASVVSAVLSGSIAAFAASWRQSLSTAKRDARVEATLASLSSDVQTVKNRLGLSNGDTAAVVSVGICDEYRRSLELRLAAQDRVLCELRDEWRETRRAIMDRR